MQPQQPYQPQPQETREDLNFVKNFGINPAVYMHVTIKQILSAPHQAFTTGNIEAGINSFVMGVNQLEAILKADELFKGDYPAVTGLIEYKNPSIQEEYGNAQKKFKHLLELAFSTRTKELEGIL